MIVAKLDKIGEHYGKYLYLHDSARDGLPNTRILKTQLLGSDISNDPSKEFEVITKDENAYIIDDNGNDINVGYTSRYLLRFFFCQIV